MTRTTVNRLARLLAMTAATAALALAAADPAAAAIDGGHDGAVFLAIAHDGSILHDATVSTEGHFAVDKFTIDGPGLRAVPDHYGGEGIWRFDLIGHEAPAGTVICGEAFEAGRSLGHPCVTFH